MDDLRQAGHYFDPLEPGVGQSVHFGAHGSSSTNGAITFYQWDLEDDGVVDATGVMVEHVYSAAGTYTVRLRVTDPFDQLPAGVASHFPESPAHGGWTRVNLGAQSTCNACPLQPGAMKPTLAILCLVAATAACASTSNSEVAAAVERAVLDYVEAIEQAKPALIERSVATDLHKFGFSKSRETGEYRRIPMTYERLVEASAEFLPGGYVPDDPVHSVDVFEVLDKTASAKLTAFWGVDYMHLAKVDGRWQIVQVLWQTVR